MLTDIGAPRQDAVELAYPPAPAVAGEQAMLVQMIDDGLGGSVAFDRARRPRAVHQAICKGPVALPFGTVESGHGFYDLNNPARQFRFHFGYTMSDLRNHVATARTTPRSNDNLQRFRQAIEGLSG